MANIDIIGIGDKTRPLPNKGPEDFSDLNEYLNIARRTISAYAPRIRIGLAEEMLKNEDAVANIAHAAMMADWHFDGRGNIHGFRKQRIKWAIKSYVGRSSRTSKRKTLSLDRTLDQSGQSIETFSANLADKRPGPAEIVSESELSNKTTFHLGKLLDSGVISDQASCYIKMYYLQGQSMIEIAQKRGVSRQSVHDLIKRAIVSLKQAASKDIFFEIY